MQVGNYREYQVHFDIGIHRQQVWLKMQYKTDMTNKLSNYPSRILAAACAIT